MYGADAIWAMTIVAGLGGFAIGVFFGLLLFGLQQKEKKEDCNDQKIS